MQTLVLNIIYKEFQQYKLNFKKQVIQQKLQFHFEYDSIAQTGRG